jgi:hypothetical protein
MLFTLPEDARWNAERQAVEFGVEIGDYHRRVRLPRRLFQSLVPEQPSPERCVEAITSSGPGSRPPPRRSCAEGQLPALAAISLRRQTECPTNSRMMSRVPEGDEVHLSGGDPLAHRPART